MKEFIVVSDNHGKAKVLQQILEKHPNAEGFVHCGDSEMDPRDLKNFTVVTGNNDYYFKFPEYMIVTLGGKRIYVTHSHTLPYGKAIETLVARAKAQDCEIACYGHTHKFDFRTIDGVTVINPGSLYYNRDGSDPSYARITIENDIISAEKLFSKDL